VKRCGIMLINGFSAAGCIHGTALGAWDNASSGSGVSGGGYVATGSESVRTASLSL
jgi:hypothetical protein